MKKILSLALALVMLLTLSTTAFAAEITDSGSVDITYTYEGPANSYIVTIPDSMTVGTDATVSVSDVKLTGTVLTVSVSSQQYNDGWKLVNNDDSVGYTLKIGDADVANNGTVLTAKNGDTLVSATLITERNGTPKYSGNYTDTLTFSVTLTECSHIFESGTCTKCGATQPQASYTVENGVATITVPTDAATGSITTCISAALTEGATTITIDGALTSDQQSEVVTALNGNTTPKIVFKDMNLADLSDDVKWMGNPIDTAGGAILQVGSCGDNAQYMIYHTGDDDSRTLSIKGTGAMADYDGNNYAPWCDEYGDIPNITGVEIAEDITTVGINAFYFGFDINSVSLPKSIEEIRWQAFASTGLTEVTIPEKVNNIATRAFGGCSSLASVTVLATTPPTLGTDVFNYCSDNLIIYVPAESVEEYKSAWSAYADKIQPIQ